MKVTSMRVAKTFLRSRYSSINLFILWLCIGGVFIGFIAYLTMESAPDRPSYMIMYNDPLWESRIEPLFVQYLLFLKYISVPPTAGIVITVVLIWLAYGLAWHRICTLPLWERYLVFVMYMVGVNNYFLNVAIRNGLAAAIGIYASVRILQGDKRYWILLAISPLFHVSMIYLVVSMIGVALTRRFSRVSIIFLLGATAVIFVILHDWIFLTMLEQLGRRNLYGGYYERYLEAIGTERLRGYSMILFVLLILGLFCVPDNPSIRLIFFALPGLAAYMAYGASAYTRPIAPHLFFATVAFMNHYAPTLRNMLTPAGWAWCLFAFSIFSVIYALRMYGVL